MRSLRRSKRSMASDIDTATAEPGPPAAAVPPTARPATRRPSTGTAGRPAAGEPGTGSRAASRREWRLRLRRWTYVSPLTRRIVIVNLLPLALLAVGFLYLGRFEASLVNQQIEALHTQGEIFAAALSQGAVLDSPDEGEVLLPELARQMMRQLVAPTRTRARLFDMRGNLIADSRRMRPASWMARGSGAASGREEGLLSRVGDCLYDWVWDLLPNNRKFPAYHESNRAADYREAMAALRGGEASAVRSDRQAGGLMISAAVPLQRYGQVLGAVMLSTTDREIQSELRTVRLELLRIFSVTVLVTLLLSLYLAGTIARPIRRLAAAAERARGRGARIEIPDVTRRGDEIGELAESLREMTDALWQRMSAIESFAADVAHEIKNPLSSLRSAVETAARIDDPTKQRRLLAIIQDDVERLDRLITDISDASRLDAELSRLELSPIDLRAMLAALADMHEATRSDGAPHLVLDLPPGRPLIVPGIESRLSQVFLNLIANAASFSPPDGEIRICAALDGRAVRITVEDAGPGIPEEKLTAIFDRFYSERPAGEKFGTHSGLGLSISKQIVEAHRGRIWAENRIDGAGRASGARFLIRLPVAA
jgi:two-component system, OmpR family, sensor histidine kinase ChvG